MIFENTHGKEFELADIVRIVKNDVEFDYKIYVGTDSQVHRKKRKVCYVTCIVLHKEGRGGRIFINKEWGILPPKPPKVKGKRQQSAQLAFLRKRLTNEVWRSVQTSFNLQALLPANTEIIVDVDLNQSAKYKSGEYVQELVGMVTGQGFKCRAKPNAWAAMSVADRYSK